MKEKVSCRVGGVRTPPIQYEKSVYIKNGERKDENIKQVYTTIRQGNKKYSVSSLYTKIVEK